MSIIRAGKKDIEYLITLIKNRFGNVDNTADANKSVASAAKWTTARNINGMTVDGTANRTNYGTCSTAAATAAKTVACTGFALVTGSEITVKFTVTNTASNPTLNVNGTGAKAIYYRGSAISASNLTANRTYTFRYNGTQYDLVGDIDTNTTYGLASTSANGLLKQLSGNTSQFMRGDGTWATPPNTTYSVATEDSDGLLSSTDKTKLDGIAEGANKYVLPTASSTTLGGVKTTSSVTSTSGLTACPIISGVPYYKDTNTTYTLSSFGITATASELNKLDGVTTTATEFNYLDGVTSNVQTQLNGKLGTTATAASANKLATSRTISFTGDVTGSVSFDGSKNVSITATVSDLDNKVNQSQIRNVKDCILTANGWIGEGPYTQTITIDGITENDSPLVECVADVSSINEKRLVQNVWNLVDKIVTGNNQITAYCNFDKPGIDLNLRIKGI